MNVQPLANNKRSLLQFLSERSSRLTDIVTWDKQHAANQIAPAVMSSRFEWLVIFGSDGASRAVPLASWHGTVQSVYSAPAQRHNEYSEVHGATFPVHLPLWVMKTLCDLARSVYEPFCGTGTTIIAAEQLDRLCYAMEIDPLYVDVSIQRFEQFTGTKAVKWDG